MKLKISMLKDELWYGGHTNFGSVMPFSKSSVFVSDFSRVSTMNQAAPILLSTKGRYIWSDEGYKATFFAGTITIKSDAGNVKLYEGYRDLRGAYMAASKRHFPPDGVRPASFLFSEPQYSTWIELKTNQTEAGILRYAKGILDAGFPAGELIIDDGWQTDFGDWDFDQKEFHNPKGMVDKLHKMGFKVALWVVPFVSFEAKSFEKLKKEGFFVKDGEGKIAARKWWRGTSAVLDFSNPKVEKWFVETLKNLQQKYGVDGFKQDGGDPIYYEFTDKTYGNVSPNRQSELWALSALNFKYNELRATWKCGGRGIVQRLSDKGHSWSRFLGLGSIIPNMLAAGISGYAFTCPDMIGGGQEKDFLQGGKPDTEIIIRYAQCAALMPMMQFSMSVWNISTEVREEILRCVRLHKEMSGYILEFAKAAANTGTPIVRYMDYEFPDEDWKGYRQQQYMLGRKYLVAPVVHKGNREKQVKLPKGQWKYIPTGQIFNGDRIVVVAAGLKVLPYFERV